VIESAGLIRERVAGYHRLAAAYVRVPEARKVLFGTITNPYADSEILLQAEQVISVQRQPLLGFDAIQIHGRRAGRDFFSASVRVNPEMAPAAARLFRQHGYTPYSMEYDLMTGQKARLDRLWALGSD
jgi:hypothetical protein